MHLTFMDCTIDSCVYIYIYIYVIPLSLASVAPMLTDVIAGKTHCCSTMLERH